MYRPALPCSTHFTSHRKQNARENAKFVIPNPGRLKLETSSRNQYDFKMRIDYSYYLGLEDWTLRSGYQYGSHLREITNNARNRWGIADGN